MDVEPALRSRWPGRAAAWSLAATSAALLATYAAYRADLKAARQRVEAGASIVETAMGPIEYADAGGGAPFLMIHGAGGGFDQGLWGYDHMVGQPGYRVIAPSRFGYLGTPVLGDGSPAAQADAHAALLDALGVDRAVVMGASAGALSAMQLAIRHPGRVVALILAIPDSWAPPGEEATPKLMDDPFVLNFVLRSDFVMWAYTKLAPAAMFEFLGVPRALQAKMTAEERASATELMENILPVSRRAAGIVNDERNSASLERYRLEDIVAPTLILDAADVSTFRRSKYTAAFVPGARFFAFPTGGHLLIGHGEEARSAVAAFLRRTRRRHELAPGV